MGPDLRLTLRQQFPVEKGLPRFTSVFNFICGSFESDFKPTNKGFTLRVINVTGSLSCNIKSHPWIMSHDI